MPKRTAPPTNRTEARLGRLDLGLSCTVGAEIGAMYADDAAIAVLDEPYHHRQWHVARMRAARMKAEFSARVGGKIAEDDVAALQVFFDNGSRRRQRLAPDRPRSRHAGSITCRVILPCRQWPRRHAVPGTCIMKSASAHFGEHIARVTSAEAPGEQRRALAVPQH